jgi:hypothetical protein
LVARGLSGQHVRSLNENRKCFEASMVCSVLLKEIPEFKDKFIFQEWLESLAPWKTLAVRKKGNQKTKQTSG